MGYSFDHEFNDTFTVRQNLRYAQNKVSQKKRVRLRHVPDPLYTKPAALNASPCKHPSV